MMILKPPALTYPEFLGGLAVKIALGIIYGVLFLHYYHGDDTWKIHGYSLEETKILLDNPKQFFINAYTPVSAIADGKNWMQSLAIYIQDLEYALVVKTLAVFNLLSQGNYYINVVLFNLVVFWGHYWLFIFFNEIFPGSRKAIFLSVFLFLPAGFWLSGIRSDGLLFFFSSLFILNLYRKKKALAITGLTGAFIIRTEFGLLLALAAIAYLIAIHTRPRNFFLVYAIAVTIFFVGGFDKIVAAKQQKFAALKGTRFEMHTLEPGVGHYLQALPAAVNHSFFRPYIWEVKNPLQALYAAEIIFFWLLVIIALIRHKKELRMQFGHPIIIMLFIFSVSVYVFIGYIVPFPGAIVRYKIIPELIIIAFLCSTLSSRKNAKRFIRDL